MFTAYNRLLVIAPHLDDEVLGCAGLIQKIKKAGGNVYVLFLTTGNTYDFSRTGHSEISTRQKEVEAVADYLGFDDYDIAFPGDSHHLKLDVLGQKEVLHAIERSSTVAIEKTKPHIVAFPSQHSYNQDHRIAALSTHTALRPAESLTKHFVPIALSYEVPADAWSLHSQQTPDVFLPLTKEEITQKLAALRLYRSQARPFPNPRSVKAVESLARIRGSMCAHEYAEAFTSLRMVL